MKNLKIATVEQMRGCDSKAVEEYSVPDTILMENAGNAVYYAVLNELKESGIRNKKYVIFSGTGNNGGDGFVAARKLRSMGADVTVCIAGDVKRIKGSALINLNILLHYDVNVLNLKTGRGGNVSGQSSQQFSVKPIAEKEIEDIAGIIEHADVIVDALFGTGLSREVGGIYRTVIELINKSGKYTVSIDIPSGINGNTGMVMGTAVKADIAVTFGLPKIGNILYPGFEYGGKLFLSHISFIPAIYEDESITTAVSLPLPLPLRKPDGHKGDFGDALFVAGAGSYYGAPFFSAYSFLKAGGGYSRLAAPASVTPFVAENGPEIVLAPMKQTDEGSIAYENEKELLELVEKVDMVVLGPGISLNGETAKLAVKLITETAKPLIIDGDGLTVVSQNIEALKGRHYYTILTPHIGEMSRLTGKSIKEINNNRVEVLRQFCIEYSVFTVLKGAHSLIGTPSGKIYVNLSGNSGMASAGSGDVLTGTVAAALGFGLPVEDAVKAGVFLHGYAGDLAASVNGKDGMTAGDILNNLPKALKKYREEYDKIFNNYYEKITLL
ncbi:MAG: bifunctional ADP-dependent NAD(P)H-hydrate dehydratase/NAD(P)H-hydrate epimerase [Spirochaetes bacterium]|nr:MAG: bifunctional ADP-dependent NAD(P)H-hydrate dehydratase/NAD(P)H-hydrate epimerase [Spirochaetota bacterium]